MLIFYVNPLFIDIFDTDRMGILILGKSCGKNIVVKMFKTTVSQVTVF